MIYFVSHMNLWNNRRALTCILYSWHTKVCASVNIIHSYIKRKKSAFNSCKKVFFLSICTIFHNEFPFLRGKMSRGSRTGAVVSVADYGPRCPWFGAWPGRCSLLP